MFWQGKVYVGDSVSTSLWCRFVHRLQQSDLTAFTDSVGFELTDANANENTGFGTWLFKLFS